MNQSRKKQLKQIANSLESLKGDIEQIQLEEQADYDKLSDDAQWGERGSIIEDNISAMEDSVFYLEESIKSLEKLCYFQLF